MPAGGSQPDPSTRLRLAPRPLANRRSRPLVPPIELSAVYCPADLDHVDALYEGDVPGFIYAREAHPNAAQLADKLARLEGG